MDAIQQQLQVSFRYPVVFTTGVFTPENLTLRSLIAAGRTSRGGTDVPPYEPPGDPADVVCVVDDGVAQAHQSVVADIEAYCRAHGSVLQLRAPMLLLPGGEQSKNDPRHLEAIHRTIHAAGLCRHSYVIAVGGGAVLDVVGYAAATAHRGVRLIRVPTTVLAQDDSGVGVKNGVNGFGKKNYYGTFATPFAVVNDAAFLTSLLDRDWLGGVSEAVKAALIRDAAFFDELERGAPALVARDLAVMTRVVRRSAELHLAHIAGGGDPFERGSSRPLDFGHWSAHKLEQLTQYRLRHGEAVAIGVALDSTYSHLSGWLPEHEWRRIVDLLLALRLPVHAHELDQHFGNDEHPRSVLRGLEEFREHLGGQLTILFLKGIGRAFDVHEIDRGVMMRSIEILKRIETARSAAAGQEGLLAAPGRESI